MDKLDDSGKPVPFSFTCATSSGRFLEMKSAVKSVLDKNDSQIHAIRSMEKNSVKVDHYRSAKKMWVDIKDIESNEIKRVYPRTIIRFNGYKVNLDI